MLNLLTLHLLLCAITPPTTRATTRPDPHVWTTRNIELIRQATTRKAHPLASGGISTTLGFSLQSNPLLVRDPYAGEVLQILEAALAKPGGDAQIRQALEQAAQLLASIAHAHARRGDIDIAQRQLNDELPYYTWAMLARFAAEGNHPDAARDAFERAIKAFSKETIYEPAAIEEKTRYVREAVDLGRFDVASRLLSFTTPPGAWARHQLAKTYRQRGDAKRADALIDEAIAIAGKDRHEGHVMAAIAVDLHAQGQVDRAEKLLIDAMNHIEGVDFGYSGTARHRPRRHPHEPPRPPRPLLPNLRRPR